jgi:DNA polymerase-3 subunit gamma/tau
MAYQVLARKWRPQRFDDVVGQQAVTRTLRNAISSGRVAQAFVFAGSRGCGKTTTARILARALNCEQGPTADPCGECDSCVEIAQGRDIDVLEIDAASHTGIDNIREVVIAGLSIAPVRNRYKVFIIDEVHQLSTASFNALLKSIEEPPAHVVFMMATTELHKIPDTILSRSQVFEFKTIPTRAIADQLRHIAAAETIDVPDAALTLMARAAEGSMRDAQSAFDQVIAFAGQTITVDDVSTVLGLVGRDLLFDLIEAVIDEDGPRAFALADRAVESGHDLKLVCRELSRVVRDLMIASVDPDRAGDGELVEGERERLAQLAGRFSREDLMRAFDLLAKAESDIRNASQPRFHFEMALLRWMHLRKLVPLAELMEALADGAGGASTASRAGARAALPAGAGTAARAGAGTAGANTRGAAPLAPSREPRVAPSREAAFASPPKRAAAPKPEGAPAPVGGAALKDALLDEIRSGKKILYELSIAGAQRIEVADDTITFTFGTNQNMARGNLEQNRPWVESAAQRLAGRPIKIVVAQSAAPAAPPERAAEPETPATAPAAAAASPSAEKVKSGPRDLKAEALSSSAVQAMLDVFPAEIRDVEELK